MGGGGGGGGTENDWQTGPGTWRIIDDDDDDCFYIALFSALEQTRCARLLSSD